MAGKKRKKRRKSKKASAAARLSVPQLRQKLIRLLDQGKYQEALPLGKELLKRDDAQESRRLLVRAYQGRIRGLAGKGMLKEAQALLETMTARCGEVKGTERLRLVLAVRAGSWQEAVQVYFACSSDLDKQERQKIEALFGAVLLTGNQSLLNQLPDESSVATHFPMADKALQAFYAGRPEEVRAALKTLPFRSPYRDLRLLLGGCLLLPENFAEAERFFLKIPAGSPYAFVADSCRQLSFGVKKIVTAWQSGSQEEQKSLGRVLQLQSREIRFLKSLLRAARDGYRLYQVISKDRGCLPKKIRQRLLKRLLPHCGEKIVDILPRSHAMPEDEMCRLMALAAELDGVVDIAIDFWDNYLEKISLDDPRYALKSALVLRHQAELTLTMGSFYDEEVLDILYQSLQHDPTDVACWLKVIKLARKHDGLKRSYQCVNEALASLPDKPEILLVAMEAAAQRRAFKKAATLAQRVLAIDPINMRARNFLLASHLDHGRKLVRQGKTELARREFEAADMDVRSIRYRGRGRICLGMLYLKEDTEEEGRKWIEQGWAMNGSPLFSRLVTLLEAHLFAMPPAQIKEFAGELRAVAGNEPVREEVLRLADLMNTLVGRKWLILKKCVKILKGYLSRGASLQWDRSEGLLLCRALHRGGFLVALAKVAGPLYKTWPGDSEIEAYEILSRTRNNCKLLRADDVSRMVELSGEFRYSGNKQLADVLSEGCRRARIENPRLWQVEAEGIFGLPMQQAFIDAFDDDDDDDDDDEPFFPEQIDLF